MPPLHKRDELMPVRCACIDLDMHSLVQLFNGC